MNLNPNILRIYCIAAILLLGWYGWAVTHQVGVLHRTATQAGLEIERVSALENKAENRYIDLESKQRRERKDYSGEEAILASTAVMDAKEEFEELHTQLSVQQEEHARLTTQASSLQLRIVPIVAIALLHLFGFFMIRTEDRRIS